jgi:hypothetical protein
MKKILSTIFLSTVLIMFATISWSAETTSNELTDNLGKTVLANNYGPISSTNSSIHNLSQKILSRTDASARKATLKHMLLIPYNIEESGYLTGIHIAIVSKTAQEFLVGLSQGLNVYAARDITIQPSGWTGLVSDLLPPGKTFKSPSMLVIIAPEGASGFYADQFLFTRGGFSHVVFQSKLVN